MTQDLDRHGWVLEPEKPRRSDLFRRISLGGFCSLRVTLDPAAPHAPPEARFLGPDAAVSPLRKKWSEAMAAGSWNSAELLRKNIEQVCQKHRVFVKATGPESCVLSRETTADKYLLHPRRCRF